MAKPISISDINARQIIKCKPLDELDYYHGLLPINEINEFLEENGDFLVYTAIESTESTFCSENSESCDKSKVCQPHFSVSTMICIKWNGKPVHVEIVKGVDNLHRFADAGQGFDCEEDLIRYYYDKLPIPVKSNANVKPILKRLIKKEKWELSNDDIKCEKELGAGNFGKVFQGLLYERQKNGSRKSECPIKVAIKLCESSLLNPVEKLKFLEEARCMRHYNHPNVVRLIGVCAQRDPIMIVMELVLGGGLDSYLRKNRGKIDEKEKVKFSLDAAKGMTYLEAKHCIHRDLAARNCLLNIKESAMSNNQKPNYVVQIADFGMSREGTEYKFTKSEVLPVKWTAPEAFKRGIYTSKSDVWSYAILLWEIFSEGKTPYYMLDLTKTKVTKAVSDGFRMEIPKETPVPIQNLIENCWQANATERPSFKDIQTALSALYKNQYLKRN